jgi:RNA polymerase sigma-70 factor (sigma-E family)
MSSRPHEFRANGNSTRGPRKRLINDKVFRWRGARWTAVRGSALGEAGSVTGAGPAEIAALNEAIAGLYRSHRLSLLRLAAFLVDDRAIAEELVQDAFAALYQRWGSLTDKSAAPSYLRATVVNGARSAQRRQGIVRRHLRVAEPDALPPADFALLLAEEHREVVAALRRLPRRQCEVLVLRYWANLDEAEISQTLRISRGTVKSTASRALAALENTLKDTR